MSWRRLARRIFVATPLPEVVLRYRAKRLVTVLGYHRVLPPAPADYPFNTSVFSATPEEFARELKYLKSNLDVISTAELLAGLENPALMPARPAVITFDDGYVDNHTYAFPLLREAGLSACFFACTGMLGTRNIPWQEAWVCCLKRSKAKRIESPFGGDDAPYDLGEANLAASTGRFRRKTWQLPSSRVPAFMDRLREATSVNPDDFVTEPLFMTWDAAREMTRGGMEFGGHTRTHPILSRVDDPAVLHDEVAGSFADLTRELGKPPVAFAYPFGYAQFMSAEADAEIERAGFKVLFSFINGFAPRRVSNLSRLPRIHASSGEDYHSFRLRMATAPALEAV